MSPCASAVSEPATTSTINAITTAKRFCNMFESSKELRYEKSKTQSQIRFTQCFRIHRSQEYRKNRRLGAAPLRFKGAVFPIVPVCPPSWNFLAQDSNYCAVKASSTLPGIPTEKVYPDPTKTVPSTIAGPGAAIEPPFALTPFTVSKSRIVLYSQRRWPSSLENARTTPSQLVEKIPPGMADKAAVSPRGPGPAGPSIGVNHRCSDLVNRTAP